MLVVTNTPQKYEFLGLPVVRDERQGCGPLMGICSGLRLRLDNRLTLPLEVLKNASKKGSIATRVKPPLTGKATDETPPAKPNAR